MSEQIDAYPLCWPPGRSRTSQWSRESAKFSTSFVRAREHIISEVALLKGERVRWTRQGQVIISTNIALRRDGLPLAGQGQPEDVGVAVYFEYGMRQRCFACDRWKKIEDNMQAIAKTIEALRGIARWGTGDMLNAAFTGFTALPAPKGWREILGIPPDSGIETARHHYRRLAAKHHPDRGGDAARMAEINAAWERAQSELL